ncbi:MAG: transcriptional repressor [Blastocatellia bacterium]|nr:transcriptional repressor [Blastocatellia bacterium]
MQKLSLESVEKLVRGQGLKMTPQRQAIVEYLQNAKHHPTAEEVLGAVNQRFPMTSRATVYNTLNWLKESHLIIEIFENGVARFDPNTSQHHHFICRACGTVEDVAFEVVSQVPQHLPGNQQVDSFEMTLRGLCAHCRS